VTRRTAAVRYLRRTDGAGRVRAYPLNATSMFFAVPGAATGNVWANASHIAQGTKPRPLDPLGGST